MDQSNIMCSAWSGRIRFIQKAVLAGLDFIEAVCRKNSARL